MIQKLLTWLSANGASTLGIVQAVLKAVKEILTGFVNLFGIFGPTKTVQAVVTKVRDFINLIDEKLEDAKGGLLKKIVGS